MNNSKINFPDKHDLLMAIARCNNNTASSLDSAMFALRCRFEAFFHFRNSKSKVEKLKAEIVELTNTKKKHWKFDSKLKNCLDSLVNESSNMAILGNTKVPFETELVGLIENVCVLLLGKQVEYAFLHLFTDFSNELLEYSKEYYQLLSYEFLP